MGTKLVVAVAALGAIALGACSNDDPDENTSPVNMGGAGGGGGGAPGMMPPPASGGAGGSSPTMMGGPGPAAGTTGSAAGGSAAGSSAAGSSAPSAGGSMSPEPTADAGMPAADAGPEEETCDKMVPSSMDCDAKLAPGDERTCMLGSREYIVHAGKTLNLCKPTALVIDAHGATETAPQQLGREKFCAGSLCWEGLGSGWAAESDTPGGGFIAVFPQGLNNMWSASDATFMLDIVEQIEKVADIDPEHVYISGISNGGFLTFQTGCPHSDVFRGMAPNAGGSNCSSVKKPIPLISFDAEPDFAYSGHKTANMSVVTANHCKGEAKPWITVDSKYEEAVCRTAKQDKAATLVPCSQVMSATVEPTVCKIWDECDDGVKVAWCDVAPNTEHGASNAATDAHIIYENNTILNTPSLAWRFFKSFWK